MTTWRADVAYDGARFHGWAAQPGLRTVQGELEGALERIAGEPVPLTVAGRTDAGVHALGQVASFRTDAGLPEAPERALNALTGPDVAVLGLRPVADGFDARRDAKSRRYRYRVDTGRPPSPFEHGRALSHPWALDHDLLGRCAELLAGTHDFTAFTPTDTYHVRFERVILDAVWRRTGERIAEFEIEADAFMRSMVRALVGTMLEVGSGRREPADFERLLSGAPRPEAGDTAPAHGLYLLSVSYDD